MNACHEIYFQEILFCKSFTESQVKRRPDKKLNFGFAVSIVDSRRNLPLAVAGLELDHRFRLRLVAAFATNRYGNKLLVVLVGGNVFRILCIDEIREFFDGPSQIPHAFSVQLVQFVFAN